MKRRGASPWQVNRARVLRDESSSAEVQLWSELRARRLSGFKFVRQFAVGSYYVDFVCREAKLVIEVDGGTHSTDAEVRADADRTNIIQAEGYRVFRVHNTEIYENIEGVLESVLAVLQGQRHVDD